MATIKTAKHAIREIFDDYAKQVIACDAGRWIENWTEDGVQLPPGGPMNIGKQIIYTSISAYFEAFGSRDFEIVIEEVQETDEWAYAMGTYSVTWLPKDGSGPIHFEGKFLTIFKRQPDGAWKIHRDCFNSNTPGS